MARSRWRHRWTSGRNLHRGERRGMRKRLILCLKVWMIMGLGLGILCKAIKSGFASSIFTCYQLIHLYSNHSLVKDAHKLFDEIPHSNVLCADCIVANKSSVSCHSHIGLMDSHSLYTYEGQGRQNRKLAMAHHKRHKGRSQFIVAQNVKGIISNSDDSFLGTVTANLMGSKYCIWDEGHCHDSHRKQPKPSLAVVNFVKMMVHLMKLQF